MIMILKQKKIKFKPRINLNHNIHSRFLVTLRLFSLGRLTSLKEYGFCHFDVLDTERLRLLVCRLRQM